MTVPATPAPRPEADHIHTLLAALRAAGFPGAVARRQVRTVRSHFRSRREIAELEPAIAVGQQTWTLAESADGKHSTASTVRSVLTGLTPDGDYVPLGHVDAAQARIENIDEAKVLRALEAHARLHGVRVLDPA